MTAANELPRYSRHHAELWTDLSQYPPRFRPHGTKFQPPARCLLAMPVEFEDPVEGLLTTDSWQSQQAAPPHQGGCYHTFHRHSEWRMFQSVGVVWAVHTNIISQCELA